MFTGIIEEVGKIERIDLTGRGSAEVGILCELMQEDLRIGDSIAVDGVCLTVTRFDSKRIIADLSPETLESTLFASKKSGVPVNLERALKVGGRLGGHMLLGHVDGVSEIQSMTPKNDFYDLEFTFDSEIKPYLVKKGSVAINGISLTIAEVDSSSFRVAVIPHTLAQTSLKDAKKGQKVHLETDILARYVEGLLFHGESQKKSGSISLEYLKEHGFDL